MQYVTLRCVFCSTDKGTVQKVIVLPRDDLQTEELVLEEVEVFKVHFLFFHSLSCTVSLSLSLTLPVLLLLSLSWCHTVLITCSLFQVPTPITTMKISSKRVSISVADDLIDLQYISVLKERDSD